MTNVVDVACTNGAPNGSRCKSLTVTACPGIANETIDAMIAILSPQGTTKGTVVHFSGGGGQGFEAMGTQQYAAAGAEGNGGLVAYHCASQADGCQDEGLGASGTMQAINALVAGCKPRH